VRWFTAGFSRDSDLLYGAFEFDVVLNGRLDMYPTDLPNLTRELAGLLTGSGEHNFRNTDMMHAASRSAVNGGH